MVNQLAGLGSFPSWIHRQVTLHPSVPLRLATLGATMGSGERIFAIPGKQLRSSRCLIKVSGHRLRQQLDAVPICKSCLGPPF